MKARHAFTLIELVIVIAVLAIIAVIAMPRLVDLLNQSYGKAEDGVVEGLRSALRLKHADDIAAGGDPNAWPSVNPFTLLKEAPPNQDAGYPLGQPDNKSWRWWKYGSGAWMFYCPHFNGDWAGGGATRGRLYIYCYSSPNAPVTIWEPHTVGELWCEYDFGHSE